MRRRKFIALACGAATAWPLAVNAQQPSRTYRLGFFAPYPKDLPGIAALLDELRQNGFVAGQNLTLSPSGFNIPPKQIASQAEALVRDTPDAIFTGPDVYTRAIQSATRTIPIVAVSGDMVGAKLVASYDHPGGNTTGVSMFAPELDGKRQQILMEISPSIRQMAVMVDPAMTQSTPKHLQDLQELARSREVELSIIPIANPGEIVPAINAAGAAGAKALNFLASPMFLANRQLIIERVAVAGLPAIFQWPEIADDGGLAAYGARTTEIFRQAARLLVKVLRGTEPAMLPVEQPTKFELVINLKTAKTLGLEIPPTLLVSADRVIE